MIRETRSTAVLAAVVLIAWAGVAHAAPTSVPMIGTWVSINPSVGGGGSVGGGPATVGSGPSNFGSVFTSGRDITVPAGQFFHSGVSTRFFPSFGGVAQLTVSAVTTQRVAVFKSGSGAAAGGDISFCPAIGVPVGSPPFATGNTACTNFASPGAGNFAMRMGANNTPGAPRYGGVLKMLRNRIGSSWFVPVQPTLSNPTAVVSKVPNVFSSGLCPANNPDCALWTPGISNYRFQTDFNSFGPNYGALLTPSGRISTLLSSLGTPTGTVANGSNFGFKMTTGTISGSDIFPPNNTTATPFFFFTRDGTDSRTTTTGGAVTGNIVMVGGSMGNSPASGNLFNRVTILSMRVPEPGMGLSLAAGLLGLGGLTRLRSRS